MSQDGLPHLTAAPNAAELMRGSVVSVRADCPLDQAAQSLLAWRFPSVPVEGAGGNLVGILSDVDCMRSLSDRLRYGWAVGVVADVMTPSVVTVAASADLLVLSEVFTNNKHNALPVVDASGAVCGVVSRRDVLSALSALVASKLK